MVGTTQSCLNYLNIFYRHNLPESPPDSGSEPPYSPPDPGAHSPRKLLTILIIGSYFHSSVFIASCVCIFISVDPTYGQTLGIYYVTRECSGMIQECFRKLGDILMLRNVFTLLCAKLCMAHE
jgi:hypothetical protein